MASVERCAYCGEDIYRDSEDEWHTADAATICPKRSGILRHTSRSGETPDEVRQRVEASTVDPEDHDYQGDGTSRCPVCLGSMNEHISWEKT